MKKIHLFPFPSSAPKPKPNPLVSCQRSACKTARVSSLCVFMRADMLLKEGCEASCNSSNRRDSEVVTITPISCILYSCQLVG